MPRPRSSKSLIPPWLDGVQQPAILFDADGKIASVNAAGNLWLGLSGEVWKNRKPHPGNLHSEDATDRRLSGLTLTLAGEALESRQVLFALDAKENPEQRLGTLARLTDINGRPLWTLVVVDASNSELQATTGLLPGDIARARAEVARQRTDSRRTMPVLSLIGSSPDAELLRAQVAAAESANSHLMISGAPGSEREALAWKIYRQRFSRSANPPPLTTIRASVGDAVFIADALRLSQSDQRTFDPPVICWLLSDVQDLDAGSQAELANFLRIHPGQLCLFATSTDASSTVRQASNHSDALHQPVTTAPNSYLFGQLGAQTIQVPPLRCRRPDIPAIATGLIDSLMKQQQRPSSRLTTVALESLLEYRWPGDLAELVTAVTSAVAEAVGSSIEFQHFPPAFRLAVSAQRNGRLPVEQIKLDEFLKGIEKELIVRALAQAKQNRSQAARLLEISRARLLRRCEQLQLDLGREPADLEPIDFEEAAE